MKRTVLVIVLIAALQSCWTKDKVCVQNYGIGVRGASLTAGNSEAYCMWYETDTLYSELNFMLTNYKVGVEYGCSETKPAYLIYNDSLRIYALDTLYSGNDTLDPYENLLPFFRKELSCGSMDVYVFNTDSFPMFTMHHNVQHFYFELPTNKDVVLASDVVISFF